MKTHYQLQEIVETYQIEKDFVTHCLRCHWLKISSPTQMEFDEEDLARILLIQDLKRTFEVNDEAVPIILHLVDQLNHVLKR